MKKVFLIVIFILTFFLGIISVKAKEIEDGTYIISSSIDCHYSLDLDGATAKNSSNIQLYQSNWTNAQKWKITKGMDGYYTIRSQINNDYVLDVVGGQFANSTNVDLYQNNGTNAQKWIIKSNGDYFNIFTYDNKYSLDINGGIVGNFSNVQIYQNNGTNAQKFIFSKVDKSERTIDDGVYTISSSLDKNKSLDIQNGMMKNLSNIQIYQTNNTEAQMWIIKYLENGYYKLTSYKNMDYSLDVDSGNKINMTNVQLYKYNQSAAQQWIIKNNNDGTFTIISKANGLSLDVANGKAVNGANIWLYEQNGTSAQKFKFNKVENIGSKSIDDGYYFIASAINRNKNFDIPGGNMTSKNNVQIYDTNSTLAQKWHIKYINNGYYEILSNKDGNYALSVDSLENNDMITVNINEKNDSDYQKWVIKDNYDGTYSLIAKNNKYIDLNSGSTNNGTKLWLYEGNNTNAQKFKLLKTSEGTGISTLDNGIYIIESALNTNKVLDVPGGNSSNGINLQIYDSNGTNAQKWQLSYVGNGIYKVVSLKDLTKSLDVAGGSVSKGSVLDLYDYNGTYAQEWLLKDAGDGYYYIVSNSGGLVLDVYGADTANGTKVWMYDFNGTNAQKFKIRKVKDKNYIIDVSVHQGQIDWNKVYNTGIYGVMLRIGYWNTEDGRLNEYISEVKRLGIPYGIYLFSYANTTNGANTEANFTKSIISKYNLNPTLGIYYDLEDWKISSDNTSETLSKDQYDNIARTYISSVSSYVSSKYKVKIYADLNHVNNRFGSYARGESDWIAQYNNTGCTYTGRYSMWQYTSSATLDGIRGYVDMSILY